MSIIKILFQRSALYMYTFFKYSFLADFGLQFLYPLLWHPIESNKSDWNLSNTTSCHTMQLMRCSKYRKTLR